MSNLKYTNLPSEASSEDVLTGLALDVSWPGRRHRPVLGSLNPELWDLTHNPWAVLQTVSTKRLETTNFRTRRFKRLLDDLTQSRERTTGHRAGFSGPTRIAAENRRLLQHGVHVERSVADLFGRTRQCGRRSAQGGQ